jgi:hypothetical protein
MASISSVQPKTILSRGDADLIGPLAFSLVGLLTHCLALVMQAEPSLASLRFTLICERRSGGCAGRLTICR